ncbi:MAG: hypothetical protein JKY81_05615 [Colwellia sp.]|nr:hypothetical protein [Colwellia sp.]
MASSGEINGTPCIVQNGSGEVVGQGSLTHTYGGTLIETSNQSNGDFITYMEGENAGKQHIFAGEFTYNNDTQFRKVRGDVFSATSDTYTLTFISDATTDESFSGTFFPTGLTDNIGQGVKVTTALSFNSSGAVVHVPAVT